MGQPAARVTDMHTCPMFDGPKPHVGGPILPPCAVTVLTGGLPQARVTDLATCVGPPDMIAKGSATVLVNSLPAARMGDMTMHGGVIVLGCVTVLIGDAGGGGGGGGGAGAAPTPPKKPGPAPSGPGEDNRAKGPGGGSASGGVGGDSHGGGANKSEEPPVDPANLAKAEQLLGPASDAEKKVTPALTAMAEKAGMKLEGLDFRLKTAESLARKLADTPPEQIADALRYTMVSSADAIADNAANTLASLEAQGYKVLRVKNTFKDGAPYKGINTNLVAPNGQVFELQFHTPDSLDMKQNKTHEIYEKLRVLPAGDPKAAELTNQMVGMSSMIPNPPGLKEKLAKWPPK